VCGRLVVVAATADSVSHPSHDHEHHADDEKYDPNGPQQGDLQQETGDEKDDSEDDHDVYLVSIQMDWAGGLVFEGVFDLGPGLFGVAFELIDASLGGQAGVAGGTADELLGGAFCGFGLVRELLNDAHCGFLRCQ